MTRLTIALSEPLADYLRGVSVREHPAMRELRLQTEPLPMAMMQIAPEQAALMATLVRILGARRTLEIGTFTGYSALAVALALPEGGEVLACDVSEEWTSMARHAWAKAGVADRIRLHLRPALETLAELRTEGQDGTFDFAFIDADKANYDHYYEQCLRLVRRGGLIAIDNVLWSGAVIDNARQDADTRAIRALNLKIRDDSRVEPCMVPIGDGLTLAWVC